jgi:hypothetical protein
MKTKTSDAPSFLPFWRVTYSLAQDVDATGCVHLSAMVTKLKLHAIISFKYALEF